MFWFHCGRCGCLFQARIGDLDDRLCSKCGFDPSFGVQLPAPRPVPTPVAPLPSAPARVGRKPKTRYLMVKLGLAWLAVLALIVGIARWRWHREPSNSAAPVAENPATTPTAEDLRVLQECLPACAKTFAGFLAAVGPEQRNQYVLNPVATASRMASFYNLNPIVNIDPASLEMESRSVLHTPDGPAIEVLWHGKNDEKYDCLFRNQDGEWRLDWEHFARYADYPWALFLAGNGPPEGEFRLLARERLAEERKNAESISLVLYAPRVGHPRDARFQSPEFLVPRSSRDGRLIEAALRLQRDGGRVYDSGIPNVDPEEMVRLRLRVRRIDNNGERQFEILRVAACHWYSTDHPGLEIPVKAPEPDVAKPGSIENPVISDGK